MCLLEGAGAGRDVVVGAGRDVACRRLCHSLLARLPPDALRSYRNGVDPQAKKWLEQAETTRDCCVGWWMRRFAAGPAKRPSTFSVISPSSAATSRKPVMAYQVGRLLQGIGMIVLPLAIIANVAPEHAIDLRTSLMFSSLGVRIFRVGWLIQHTGATLKISARPSLQPRIVKKLERRLTG
jgi:hypothetical protein